MIRGTDKTQTIMIYDEYYKSIEGYKNLSYVLEQFKQNPNIRKGFFIKRDGSNVPVTIPPLTGLVTALRLLFNEHGSGKLYLKRQLNVTGPTLAISNWIVYMWGGGRTKPSKIREVDVKLKDLPKVLQLLDLIDG
jgi:hypothetical protein